MLSAIHRGRKTLGRLSNYKPNMAFGERNFEKVQTMATDNAKSSLMTGDYIKPLKFIALVIGTRCKMNEVLRGLVTLHFA